jgi:glutathione S-transferase
MSITYYYSPMSTAVRTTWAIEELSVPCERRRVDIPKKETKSTEFLKLNPNGVVPLLVVDGLPIFESTAILIYLGETFGVEKGLYAPPGLKRAEMLRWIIWANVTFADAVNRWMRNTSSRLPEDQKNAKAGEIAASDLSAAFKVVDDALAGRTYLVGESFSLADLAVTSYLGWLRFMNYDHSQFKNASAWGGRCLGRPAAVTTAKET